MVFRYRDARRRALGLDYSERQHDGQCHAEWHCQRDQSRGWERSYIPNDRAENIWTVDPTNPISPGPPAIWNFTQPTGDNTGIAFQALGFGNNLIGTKLSPTASNNSGFRELFAVGSRPNFVSPSDRDHESEELDLCTRAWRTTASPSSVPASTTKPTKRTAPSRRISRTPAPALRPARSPPGPGTDLIPVGASSPPAPRSCRAGHRSDQFRQRHCERSNEDQRDGLEGRQPRLLHFSTVRNWTIPTDPRSRRAKVHRRKDFFDYQRQRHPNLSVHFGESRRRQ